MVSKYADKNKFGGSTWQIKIDRLFHIYIHETNIKSYLIEFKEWKWISFKVHFSYMSDKDLKKTINEVFDKVYFFFKNHNNFIWTDYQRQNKLEIVLNYFENLGEISNIKDDNSAIKKALNQMYGFGSSVPVPKPVSQPISQNNIEKKNKEEKYNINYESVDSLLKEIAKLLNEENLDEAIYLLEMFTKNNGENLPVLIKLAKLKILKRDKIETQNLIFKILEIMKNNLGSLQDIDIIEFDYVIDEFKKL